MLLGSVSWLLPAAILAAMVSVTASALFSRRRANMALGDAKGRIEALELSLNRVQHELAGLRRDCKHLVDQNHQLQIKLSLK